MAIIPKRFGKKRLSAKEVKDINKVQGRDSMEELRGKGLNPVTEFVPSLLEGCHLVDVTPKDQRYLNLLIFLSKSGGKFDPLVEISESNIDKFLDSVVERYPQIREKSKNGLFVEEKLEDREFEVLVL